jgi:hypothetical protein
MTTALAPFSMNPLSTFPARHYPLVFPVVWLYALEIITLKGLSSDFEEGLIVLKI